MSPPQATTTNAKTEKSKIRRQLLDPLKLLNFSPFVYKIHTNVDVLIVDIFEHISIKLSFFYINGLIIFKLQDLSEIEIVLMLNIYQKGILLF